MNLSSSPPQFTQPVIDFFKVDSSRSSPDLSLISIAHLVLLVSVLVPRFQVGLLLPADVRVPGGQTQRVVGRPAHADGGAHVQRDQLSAIIIRAREGGDNDKTGKLLNIII